MRPRAPAALLSIGVTLLTAVSALAQAIDLSVPYGNQIGCANKELKQLPEGMLLVTDKALTTVSGACTFVQKLTAPDGTLVVTTLCDIEDEGSARSVGFFSIARSKSSPEALVVSDEYGSVMDEVVPCR